jgi:uncharacterized membrane protein YcaP (DUF421 family)
VIVFLIGGVIILSTTGNDRSETNTICAVLTIGLMHRSVSTLKQKYPRLGAWIDGTPLVLLKDGEWQQEAMQRMRVQDTDVMASARLKGVKTLSGIKYAVLERNGAISVIKSEE